MQRARADQARDTTTAPPSGDVATGPSRPPRRGRRLLRWLVATAVLLAVGVGVGLFVLSRQDAQHALFYNSGKTLNGFLGEYCDALDQAIVDRDAAPLARFYSAGFASPGRGAWRWHEATTVGQVQVARLESDAADAGPAEVLADLQAYVAGFGTVESSVCKIDLIETMEPGQSAVLTVKVHMGGIDPAGRRFEDRQEQRWHLLNQAPRQAGVAGAPDAVDWRIMRDELVDGVRVAGDGQRFVELDPAAIGLDFTHQRDPKLHMKKFARDLKFGVIQHASGGVAAADFDGDGFDDLFFADGRKARLYRHSGLDRDGLPRFSDVTDSAGLGTLDGVNAGLFADIDNDGDRDLFVLRYLAPSRLFVNNGDGTLTDRSTEYGLDFVAPGISPTFLDYDRDGFLDLYVGCTGNAFEALPRLPFYATNGGKNRLFRNDGGKGFIDVTDASGVGDTGWTLAVASADYDADGWPDLALANDFGRKVLFRNNGDGTFTDQAKAAGVLDFSGGMGLTFGDFDEDGKVDLYTSNINSNQRWFGEDNTVNQYIRNVARSRWFVRDMLQYMEVYKLLGDDWVTVGQQIGEGNSLFHNNGDGTFRELNESQTRKAGWGWSVAFLDVDNDTDLDLYAANGWISNTPGTDL